ncbi:MAG: class I SAM-dependent DNA methyltransferase [Marinilabiliaceae bacterium]
MSSSKQAQRVRQPGDVYTKPEVVKFILDLVGYVPTENLSQVSIIEPACGEGEFLLEIMHRLKQSSNAFRFDFKSAFHRCVTAVDIDSSKIRSCIEKVRKSYPEINNPESNIIAQDFLLSEYGRVDIVVGNPPYIRYEDIPEDKLPLYKAFSTFYYRADIYVLFFEKSLSLLKEAGRHGFICANRWMRNKYGKRLREFITDHYNILRVINMESADAFQQEVLAYPAITVIENSSKRGQLLYADVSDIRQLPSCAYCLLPAPSGDDWSGIFSPASQNLNLIEELGFKIGIGIATGADSIFISKDFRGTVEEELLLPVIGAKDLSGDTFRWGWKLFLNPYEADGKLIDLDKYPKAKEYLERHRDKLASRHKARRNPARWYGTIDSVDRTLTGKPKILVPDISGNTRIFVDSGNFYPQHNIYYVTGQDERTLKLLASFLMSDFVRRQLSSLSNRMNGGFARWQSQYLRKIRIPDLRRIPYGQAEELLDCYNRWDIMGINRLTSAIVAAVEKDPNSGNLTMVGDTTQEQQKL